jgi:hypothetical protein
MHLFYKKNNIYKKVFERMWIEEKKKLFYISYILREQKKKLQKFVLMDSFVAVWEIEKR